MMLKVASVLAAFVATSALADERCASDVETYDPSAPSPEEAFTNGPCSAAGACLFLDNDGNGNYCEIDPAYYIGSACCDSGGVMCDGNEHEPCEAGQPTDVYGCTDPNAINYVAEATLMDANGCVYRPDCVFCEEGWPMDDGSDPSGFNPEDRLVCEGAEDFCDCSVEGGDCGTSLCACADAIAGCAKGMTHNQLCLGDAEDLVICEGNDAEDVCDCSSDCGTSLCACADAIACCGDAEDRRFDEDEGGDMSMDEFARSLLSLNQKSNEFLIRKLLMGDVPDVPEECCKFEFWPTCEECIREFVNVEGACACRFTTSDPPNYLPYEGFDCDAVSFAYSGVPKGPTDTAPRECRHCSEEGYEDGCSY